MKLTIIAAHDPNLVIGKNGELPWSYPEDIKHFKANTIGKPILMGRGVFEELKERPLPERRNIVLSKTKSYNNVETFSSLEKALEEINVDELMIIGGGVLYRKTLPMADRLLITQIKRAHKGDTFFPEYRNGIGTEWKEISRKIFDGFDFVEYKKL